MAPTPTWAEAKLARVRELLESLDSTLQTFREEHPYRTEVSTNADDTKHFVHVFGVDQVSTDAGLVAGEILYHLRSVLDQMVYALVKANGGKPGNHTEFPIFSDPAGFQKGGVSKLRGVSPQARQAIESLQPYQTSLPSIDEWAIRRAIQSNPLFILNELARIDRHRFMSVVRAFIEMQVPVMTPGHDRPNRGGGTSVVLSDGLQIYWCSYRAPTRPEDVTYPLVVHEVLDGEWDPEFAVHSEGGVPSAVTRLTGLADLVDTVVKDLSALL